MTTKTYAFKVLFRLQNNIFQRKENHVIYHKTTSIYHKTTAIYPETKCTLNAVRLITARHRKTPQDTARPHKTPQGNNKTPGNIAKGTYYNHVIRKSHRIVPGGCSKWGV